MKKLTRIIVLALALVLAVSAFVFSASAEEAPFLVEGLHRYTWEEAIDNADAEHPIKLLGNYTVGADEVISISQSVTIDLNGNTLTSTRSDGALFLVSGEGTELNIIGPGTINVGGTLVEIDGYGAKLNLSSEGKGITVSSKSSSPLFVVGGENKVAVTLGGTLNFKLASPISVFELHSASTLTAENASVTLSASAPSEPASLVASSENTSVKVRYSSITVSGGNIFKAFGETTEISPALILCEYSTLASEGSDFGTILDSGSEYVEMNVRISTVTASGAAFKADDTLNDYILVGGVEEYAKPTAIVHFTGSTYALPAALTAEPSLFRGNISGIVNSSTVTVRNNVLAIGTRLWDGACGILLKSGVRCVGILSGDEVASELEAPITLGTTTVYHDPDSATNQNFTFEDIDGITTEFYQVSRINGDHTMDSYFVLGIPQDSYTIDATFTTNFNNYPLLWNCANGDSSGSWDANSIISKGWGDRYGSAGIVAREDGNQYYKFEFNKADYAAGKYELKADPYAGFFVGQGTKSGSPVNPTYKSDYITIDFDLSSDTVVDGKVRYADLGFNLMQRNGTSTQVQNFTGINISNGKFRINGKDVVTLPDNVGEWTHVTFILEINSTIDYDAAGKFVKNHLDESKAHIYINGTYCGSTSVFSNAITTWTPKDLDTVSMDEVRLNMTSRGNINSTTENFSICVDNVAVIHYKNGYQGDICSLFGEDGIDTSINLNELSDVVYGLDYQFPAPNTPNDPLIVVDDTNYYNVDAALAAISEGSVVELYTDVNKTFEANVAFTLYKNGHNFEVSSLTHYIAPIWGEDDAYKISKSARAVTVYWAVGNDYYENTVPIGMIPRYDGPATGYAEGGKLFEACGWSYASGASSSENIAAVTKADIDRGYIILYPIYKVTKVQVDFCDGDTVVDTGYFGIDELPEYAGEAFASEIKNGLQIDVVGWSYSDAAESVDEIAAISDLSSSLKLYAVHKATAASIKFVDAKSGNTDDKFSTLGEAPVFAGTNAAGEWVNGQYIEFVGWTRTEGSTETVELAALTEADANATFFAVYKTTRIHVYFYHNGVAPAAPTVVNVGEAPRYTESVPEGVTDEENGVVISLIGWSRTEGAQEPDASIVVGADDANVKFYSVYGASRVRVTFLDEDGQVLTTGWADALSTLAQLSSVNDGSSFGLVPDAATGGYIANGFSGWKLQGSDASAIGREPVTVVPEFNKPVINAVKYNVSFLRLNMLRASIFVKVPGAGLNVVIDGFYADEKLQSKYEMTDVTINGESYKRVTFDENTIDKYNESYIVYLKYTHNGVEYVVKYNVGNVDKYFESLLTSPDSSDAYKRVAMEMMRYCDSYIRLQAKGSGLASFAKYSTDPDYSKYLRDLTKVNTLFGEDYARDISKTEPYVEKVMFDFKENIIRVYTDSSIPRITGGWADGQNNGIHFAQAWVDKDVNNYKTHRMGVGVVNGSDIYFTCPLAYNESGTIYWKDFNAFSTLVFRIFTPGTGGQFGPEYTGYYTLAHSIAQYEALYAANPTSDVANYLELARSFYSASYEMRAAMGTTEGAFAS